MTRGVLLTSGLVGLYMAIVLDALIAFGKSHYGSTAIGSSIGLSAFALMLVVAAYESRSVSLTALVSDTFDNARMNWIALVELALVVMITQMDHLQPPARHGAAEGGPVRPGARRRRCCCWRCGRSAS